MLFKLVSTLAISATLVAGFASTSLKSVKPAPLLASQDSNEDGTVFDRRTFVSSLGAGGVLFTTSLFPATAEDGGEESFASISARASKLSSNVAERTPTRISKTDDNRTAYDFSIPIQGEDVPFKDIVHQEYDSEGIAKLKAILVVNMKEDDPVARKDIPEFIALAAKYVIVTGVSNGVNILLCELIPSYSNSWTFIGMVALASLRSSWHHPIKATMSQIHPSLFV